MLDYTAGSLPVTFADRFTDHKVPHYNPMSSKDRTNWELCEFLVAASHHATG